MRLMLVGGIAAIFATSCLGLALAAVPRDGLRPALEVEQNGTLRTRQCQLPTCLMVDPNDLKGLLDANDRMAVELKALRESKGCARLEVLPGRRT